MATESILKQLSTLPDNFTSRTLRKVFARFALNDTEITRATRTLLAYESGLTVFLNAAAEFDTVLPPLCRGLRFTFIVMAAPSGASYTVSTSASANIIKGLQTPVDGTPGDFGTADDTINFVDGQAVAGDKVELYCDGVSWYAYAVSKVAAGITFTQVS